MKIVGKIAYARLEQIGVGLGMNSKVYLADEPQLGGQVAVKEIEKARFGNPTEYFNEAKVMFRGSHDNVVAIQYACQTNKAISLVMPYYRRGPLTERIKDRPLRLCEVLRVAQAVLAGLAHIHVTGYIHFDLKPSNVLFSDSDRPMVADFGQARSISSTGAVTVPPMYYSALPPETISTSVGTIQADIYQMGLLLYRALNGDEFFKLQISSDDAVLRSGILKGTFPARRRFMPHVPRQLRRIVRKALRVNPVDRFQSATDMADTLSRVRVKVDWAAEPLSGGGFRWRGAKSGCVDSVVELTRQGDDWRVQTFTQRGKGSRRAKNREANWSDRLSLDQAHLHLKHVFETLLE